MQVDTLVRLKVLVVYECTVHCLEIFNQIYRVDSLVHMLVCIAPIIMLAENQDTVLLGFSNFLFDALMSNLPYNIRFLYPSWAVDIWFAAWFYYYRLYLFTGGMWNLLTYHEYEQCMFYSVLSVKVLACMFQVLNVYWAILIGVKMFKVLRNQ